MIVAGKEIELAYNMKAIKSVQEHFGLQDFAELPEFLKSVGGNIFKLADFCVACVFYGCKEFSSIEELESLIESSEEIAPAAGLFLAAFNKFYGIKSEPESGEPVAPLDGSN
jgi:hypothetical protein